ncbi:hypothetical protein [Fredinandcohnia quinoae]|uniref:Uncharacterized protein n=1 Tax=Fredinandcohnia quinoae TaxID=2918902 RepID=A0AAW5E466_9BACI|nr:hypothetical protein [Fredinandcohnia sp. SECRCQ15]MCH1627737.1 hypothetical protein [Fredinandcohnia sp. SECRCQ15]
MRKIIKRIKIENEDIKKAICSGETYIQVDNRSFLLFEVDEIEDDGVYNVADSDEEELLLSALNKDNPLLSDEEIIRILDNER